MQTTITNKLTAIQRQFGIKVLFACESGSRGWQFASPDSDYDVRFIYIRPYKYYLSMANQGFDLNFPINNELDIYGWDLRKALPLMLKSNTTPFEWLQSPIVYDQWPGFRDELWALCQHYFSQRSNIHHYLGIAAGAREALDYDGMIGIKKLFYILRPLLAAKWCLEKDAIAPMTIGPLMELLPAQLQLETAALIKEKSNRPEAYKIRLSDDLRCYIDQELTAIDAASKGLARTYFKPDKLDDFFIQTITSHDN